jgi:hypothetical protein
VNRDNFKILLNGVQQFAFPFHMNSFRTCLVALAWENGMIPDYGTDKYGHAITDWHDMAPMLGITVQEAKALVFGHDAQGERLDRDHLTREDAVRTLYNILYAGAPIAWQHTPLES